MTTEELYKKYGDVKVMAVETDNTGEDEDIIIIEPKFERIIENCATFEYRYLMETNTRFRQVIPYCLIRCNNNYFVTKRLDGDNRLVGKCSLGLGGHIDYDENIWKCNNIIRRSLKRELEEELNINIAKQIKSIKLVALIHCNQTEVDKVHLGLVYIIDVIDYNISVKETDVLDGMWTSKESLVNNVDIVPFETWTRLIIEQIIKKGIET